MSHGDEVVVARGPAAVGRRAPARRLTRHVLGVLDSDRHAEQRPFVAGATPRVCLLRIGERALDHHSAKGVELRLQPLDPLQVELDQLARGDLAFPDHLSLTSGAGKGQVIVLHARAGYPPPHA